MSKPDIAAPGERWTHIEAYLGGLARRRTARGTRFPSTPPTFQGRSLILSTLPFAILIAMLGMMAVVFAIDAWPSPTPEDLAPRQVERKQGTAPPGWFDEARKDMR